MTGITEIEIEQLLTRCRAQGYVVSQSALDILDALSRWTWPPKAVRDYENVINVVASALRLYGQADSVTLSAAVTELQNDGQLRVHTPPSSAPLVQPSEPAQAVEKTQDQLGPVMAADKPIPMVLDISEPNTAIQDGADLAWNRPNYRNLCRDLHEQCNRESFETIEGVTRLNYARAAALYQKRKAQIDADIAAKENKKSKPVNLQALEDEVEKLRRLQPRWTSLK